MPDQAKLTQTTIRAGVWEGVLLLAGKQVPKLEVTLLGQPLTGASVAAIPARPGEFSVRVPIPAEVLSEGVQTFLIQSDGQTLAHFSIVTGAPLEDDLRAEIDLLRAELDLLKRAFRRYAVENAPR